MFVTFIVNAVGQLFSCITDTKHTQQQNETLIKHCKLSPCLNALPTHRFSSFYACKPLHDKVAFSCCVSLLSSTASAAFIANIDCFCILIGSYLRRSSLRCLIRETRQQVDFR
ncbi:hypothetical protein L596_006542 [Steinernema carpocapsae]|uniref:Uncharacterized protein n=1 Tax=Steinernema carpocapsae TaxID=34508 RepID=A0A4U8V2G8_STECR|nr:hypothetical protein L596_006542 [Steinernema carpocapsae]